MAEPFVRRARSGALATVLPGRRVRSAIAEIEGLLADARRVTEVSVERVREVAGGGGLEGGLRLRTARGHLYRRYLEHCFLDGALSEEEHADLAHLRHILALDDGDVAAIHDEVARALYGQSVDRVLEDHRLDPEEAEFLGRLASELRLDPTIAQKLEAEGAGRARRRFLERRMAHERTVLTPKRRMVELRGSSSATLDDAVRAAVVEAGSAVSDLRWLEITRIRADVEGTRVVRWHTWMKAGFGPDGEEPPEP